MVWRELKEKYGEENLAFPKDILWLAVRFPPFLFYLLLTLFLLLQGGELLWRARAVDSVCAAQLLERAKDA